MSFFQPETPTAAADPKAGVPEAPRQASAPTSTRPAQRSMTPSFLGPGATPSQSPTGGQPGKTLLGA